MSDHLLGIAGLTPGGVGIYALLTTVLGALIKTWPVLTKMSLDAKTALRAEKRTDAADCQARIAVMEARIDLTEQRAHSLEMKFTLSLAAYRIVVAELHTINPKSAAIAQAQALLSPDMMAQLPEERTDA
ncbi:MAG: hypothetical protein ACOYLS_01265 [Polymorphobacter sp.]